MKKVSGYELKLGDIVKLYDGPYSYATVKKITEHDIVFFRPYAATPDFTYSGGVICYVGIEELSFFRNQTFEQIS